MAHWKPSAANDLMAFAANHNLNATVGAFQLTVDTWADNLPGFAHRVFPFGQYRAEVTGNAGQVDKIEFDL
ncbi:hypothetical protein D3C76_790840 [compost metagenome]|jgi:hypothetical protein|uniref:hypothetical protein n=1 Tax=Pseudomonas TaxID=286 RepID=UPI0004D53441|nr:hypothetical protein [Pseudomonas sp. G5(2012)]KEX94175.1 hypothetical protein HA62_09105 [Pseudomonas putida]